VLIRPDMDELRRCAAGRTGSARDVGVSLAASCALEVADPRREPAGRSPPWGIGASRSVGSGTKRVCRIEPARLGCIRNCRVTVAPWLPKASGPDVPGRGRELTGSASVPTSGDPFEALGDSNRREILRLLSTGDKPVREIAAAMPISRPAVSRHLRLLKDAGLVAERAQGTRRIYHLHAEGMHAVQAYLEGIWGEAAARFRLLAENTDRTSSA
jgi:DNA-binding transcriptional ArsR family regulator